MRDPFPRADHGAELSASAAPLLIVGVGNALRGDDGAGLETARLLADLDGEDGVAVRAYEGEGVGLLDIWDGARAVWVIDAVLGSDGQAGSVRRFDAGSGPLPATLRGVSTHATSVAGGIELARTLGRLPPVVVVYGIAGASFRTGEPPCTAVRAGAQAAADAVRAEVRDAPRGA